MASAHADQEARHTRKDVRVVRSVAELRRLASLREFLLGRREEKYVLELAGLDEAERGSWERRFERHYFECGCVVGEIFVGVGCLVSVCVLFGKPGGVHVVNWGWGLGCLGWLAVAAVVGKACGLTIAYVALRRLIKEIEGAPRQVPCVTREP
jgi:hypothetical protein